MGGTNGRRFRVVCAAVAAGVMAGCSAAGSGGGEEEDASANELVTTMAVETGDGGVGLTLHVTNSTSAPVELEFRSGQRYDFAVSRLDGEELWRWSADQMFTQALGSETLLAGGSLRYSATWPARGMRGEFVARGEVTSSNRPVTQAVRFELVGDE